MSKSNESVLVIDENLLYGFPGLFKSDSMDFEVQGITKNSNDLDWLLECLKRSYFMPRGLVEEDPKYKQIIPYIILRSWNKFFVYERNGSETRLTGNYSMGIGGHVNTCDFDINGLTRTLENAARREFFEEIGTIGSENSLRRAVSCSLSPCGVLYAGGRNSSSVNKVHLGVVYSVNFNDQEADEIYLKDEGKKLSWMTREELFENFDSLELWSQLVVKECL